MRRQRQRAGQAPGRAALCQSNAKPNSNRLPGRTVLKRKGHGSDSFTIMSGSIPAGWKARTKYIAIIARPTAIAAAQANGSPLCVLAGRAPFTIRLWVENAGGYRAVLD